MGKKGSSKRAWFKHWNNASLGNSISELAAKHELEAIAAYWMILEMVSRWEDSHNQTTRGSVDCSLTMICRMLHVQGRKASRILTLLHEKKLVRISTLSEKSEQKVGEKLEKSDRFVGEKFEISIPKWLEFQGTGSEEEEEEKKRRRSLREDETKKPSNSKPPQKKEPIQEEFPEEPIPEKKPATLPARQTSKPPAPPPPPPASAKLQDLSAVKKQGNPVGYLIGVYVKAWQTRYETQRRPDVGGKAVGVLKRVLSSQSVETASDLIQVYCQMNDPWFKTKHHDLVTFEASLNKVIVALERGEDSGLNWEKIFGKNWRENDKRQVSSGN